MTEISESSKMIDLVIEKHKRFLEAFNLEYKDVETRMISIKQQVETQKKETEAQTSKMEVLKEKFHLLFHQAKKQREEVVNQVVEKMKLNKSPELKDASHLWGAIGDFEKKLQTSNSIADEEKTVMEIKKLLIDFEALAKKTGIIVSVKNIMDKLDEAISSHRELLAMNEAPKQETDTKESEKQIGETEGRYNWLKHRIESHGKALAYWENAKGGISIG
jgi:hypothetical protein